MPGTAPSLFRHGPPGWARLATFAVVALALMVVDARLQMLDVARHYIGIGLHPFQTVMRLPRDGARQVADWLDTAARIRAEDEAESRRRIELAQLATHAARLAEENRQLRRLLGVSDDRTGAPTVLVELLYEVRTQFDQRLIINKGQNAGIDAGMPVINERGLVGQVVRAGAFTAEVALLTDRAVSVPVQVLRNGLRAIAYADATPGKLELRYVPADADLLAGDLLVTSGLGGWFAPGVPVARVEEVVPDLVSGYAGVLAQPVAELDHHRHFLVQLTEGVDPILRDADGNPVQPGGEAPMGPPAPTAEPGSESNEAPATPAAPLSAGTSPPPTISSDA